MEILNLDKFSNRKQFTSNGKQYTIRGMKVKELKPFTESMDKSKEDDDRIPVMVNMLATLTNMTVDELNELEIGELSALITISQGGDPSQDKEGK